MFNEILTGKATLEPPPPAMAGGPYRAPEVPNENRTCAHCRQTFVVPATSPAQTCVACQLANAQASSPSYTYQNQADLQPSRTPFFVIRLAIAGVILLGGAIYSQVNGDAARVREAENMADEACSCSDANCAENVRSEFLSWASTHGEERVDDSDYQAVENSAERLASCVARFQ